MTLAAIRMPFIQTLQIGLRQVPWTMLRPTDTCTVMGDDDQETSIVVQGMLTDSLTQLSTSA